MPAFSGRESAVLFYCAGLADSAKTIAEQKLQGATATEIRRPPNQDASMKEMHEAMVAKVYEDSFASARGYAVDFFGDCAHEVAKVSGEQARFGVSCYQDAQLALDTVDLRIQGHSKRGIIKQFSAMKGERSWKVIDKAWAAKKSRSDAASDAWKQCMKPVTRG